MSDILNRIKHKIVDPAIQNIKTSALAYVVEVNDADKTANVIVMERDGSKRRKNNLSFDTGRGLESGYLKVGDTVEIGYRNNNYKHSYIIRIYEQAPSDSTTTKGQDLPYYTNLF